MRVRVSACVSAWLSAVVALAGACGEQAAPAPEEPDANVQADAMPIDPPGCQFSFGTTYIANLLEIRPEGEGRDFTGDGVPDNRLGFLGDIAVNGGWKESISKGWSIFLYDFVGLGLPVPAEPTPMDGAFFNGIDEDNPPDETNNLTGQGRFLVPQEQFDVSCKPTSYLALTQNGLDLHAEVDRYTFVLPWVGTIEFVDLTGDFHFSEDLSTLDFDITCVWTICGLSRAAFPGSTTGTMLDNMINGFQVTADIDRDGDGIEQAIGDGSSIAYCLDGDGTMIDGADCPCDPRMVDGYSVALHGAGVPAKIVGTLDTSP